MKIFMPLGFILFFFFSLNSWALSLLEKNEALNQACSQGDLGRVNRLLDDGADINTFFQGRWERPLCTAIKTDNERLFWLLVVKGADTNLKQEKLCSFQEPLSYAVKIDNLSFVKKILKNGAQINGFEESHNIPLHVAAQMKMPNMLNFLLSRHPFVDKRSSDGASALVKAVQGESTVMVEALLKAGAEVSPKKTLTMTFQEERNQSALYWAFQRPKEKVKMVYLLLKFAQKIRRTHLEQVLFKYRKDFLAEKKLVPETLFHAKKWGYPRNPWAFIPHKLKKDYKKNRLFVQLFGKSL